MCGIWALFGYDTTDVTQFTCALTMAHRGPDCFRFENVSEMRNAKLAFHRLEVVGNVGGMQPMRLQQLPHLTLICNGEIYNCRKLKEEFAFEFESTSDCEVILHLYDKFGAEVCDLLDGVFAYVIVDTREYRVIISRDTFGIRPMFYYVTKDGQMGVCSEVKGESEFIHTSPGCGGSPDILGLRCTDPTITNNDKNIRTLMTNAVEKRLMSYRRVGSLLSGGLDSSLVAAITAQKLRERGVEQPIQTFSIGVESSPDVIAARKVAEHIKSEHHEVTFSPQEGIRALEETIFALESYDVTTVRASIPMYLISRYISENTDTIVIMSGEGADELAQGYIYFHKQPSPQEGDIESKRLLTDLYLFDVLRTDRSTAAHGLEVRAPFLDHAFVSYFLSLPASKRMPQVSVDGVEKHLLRSSFDGTNLIPTEILWRRKEAFSDGVTSKKRSWFEILQEHIDSMISDEELDKARENYPFHTPRTKEALFYRRTFESKFGSKLSKLIPYQWLPRWTGSDDPSARVLAHYQN
uniref:Asparagine synthetase [glutamine-hydrolyzing] n=1 Tax=Ciona savignyi TaxID=51511 RepID=H2YGT1_CIOSA